MTIGFLERQILACFIRYDINSSEQEDSHHTGRYHRYYDRPLIRKMHQNRISEVKSKRKMCQRLFCIQAILSLGVGLGCICCSSTTCPNIEMTGSAFLEERYVYPLPPEELVDPCERANYLAGHYWDNYDFTDTALLSRPEFCEQTFVDFLPVLVTASREES